MDLHHHDYDHTHGTGPFNLVLLHGLFGAGSNFRAFSRQLSDEHRVIAADLRNHGASPHDSVMDYPSMVADVIGLIEREVGGRTDLFGHSMGGKVAMGVALTRPDLVERLVVVDIAPVSYGHGDVFCRYIAAMDALSLDDLASRRDADAALKTAVPDPRVRAFLLHSLRRDAKGAWCWRINLSALAENIDAIGGFPFGAAGPFEGPTLFVGGGASDYLQAAHEPEIARLFPAATIARIPGVGHWVHAEAPDELEALARPFLARRKGV